MNCYLNFSVNVNYFMCGLMFLSEPDLDRVNKFVFIKGRVKSVIHDSFKSFVKIIGKLVDSFKISNLSSFHRFCYFTKMFGNIPDKNDRLKR